MFPCKKWKVAYLKIRIISGNSSDGLLSNIPDSTLPSYFSRTDRGSLTYSNFVLRSGVSSLRCGECVPEYISEPRSTLEKFEGKSEVGVFESRPEEKEEIVKSDMAIEEVLPEKGAARNIAAKFREIHLPVGRVEEYFQTHLFLMEG
jgi:hypothetical protein